MSFTFSIPVWIHFVAFSCLILMDRNCNAMLNKSSESEHPCLVSDLRDLLTFHHVEKLVKSFDVGCEYVAFIILRMFPLYSLCGEVFHCNMMLNLVKTFFCIYQDDNMIFFLQFVNVVCRVD